MVATIVAAAHHLDPPTDASTTSQAWGGHYLRREGIQFLCRAHVDISKIQMLARQMLTCSIIYKYTDNLGSLTKQQVPTEAVTGSGL